MILHNCFTLNKETTVSIRAVIVTAVLFGVKFVYRHLKKKKMSPIMLIMISALIGMMVYGIG